MLKLDTTAVKKIVKVIQLIKFENNLDGIDIYHHLKDVFKDVEDCYTVLNLMEEQNYIERQYHGLNTKYVLKEHSLTILN